MEQVQVYSTAAAGSRAHIAYWNSVLKSLLIPLRVTALNSETFEAELKIGRFGATMLADVYSSAAIVDHDIRHVEQTGSRFFSLIMAVDGGIEFTTGGMTELLAERDLVLYDSHAPSRVRFDRPTRVLSIHIQPKSLGAYLPSPELFFGIPIRHEHMLGGLVGEMLERIWGQVRLGLPGEYAVPLGQGLVQVLGSYFGLAHGARVTGSSSAEIRRTAIKRHIEANLTDPTLSATSIAKAFGVSKRYIFRAFAGDSEPLAGYILRRRLEQVEYYLRSQLWSHWSITEIALHWGFRSVPHFSRVFRDRVGKTPGEYRRQEQE